LRSRDDTDGRFPPHKSSTDKIYCSLLSFIKVRRPPTTLFLLDINCSFPHKLIEGNVGDVSASFLQERCRVNLGNLETFKT